MFQKYSHSDGGVLTVCQWKFQVDVKSTSITQNFLRILYYTKLYPEVNFIRICKNNEYTFNSGLFRRKEALNMML